MPKKPDNTKRWFLFCEPCAFKKIIKADDPADAGLVEIPQAKIPGGVPVLDPKTKKAKDKPDLSRMKKFKCPQCGRGVMIKKLPEVYEKAYKEIDEEKRKKEQELEKQRRIEDGKPYVRNPEEEFKK